MSRTTTIDPDITSEQKVLAGILYYPNDLALIADWLKPEHFYRDAHKLIYTAMLDIYNKQKDPDLLNVCELLRRRKQLSQIDGASEADGEFYIGMMLNEYLGRIDVVRFAKHIKQINTRKRLMFAGAQIEELASHEENIEQALAKSEEALYKIAKDEVPDDVVPIMEVEAEFYQWFDRIPTGGAIVGVPTGLSSLDTLTGGLQKSDLIILAARPGMGKTSAAMTIARNTALDFGRSVLVFSLEMSRLQLFQRLLAQETRINLKRIRTGQVSPDEEKKLVDKSTILGSSPIYIDHTPAISVSSMRSRIRRTLAKHDIDLIVVDYLQKMTATDDDGKRYKSEYQEVSEIARGLKDIAREFDIPVLALSQLSRAVEGRAVKIPQLSDLRESGTIEQEADIVVFIHREDYYDKESKRQGIADFVFAKHRNGETTHAGEIELGFDASQTRFYNLGNEQIVDSTGMEVTLYEQI